jgi:hypothetical protein
MKKIKVQYPDGTITTIHRVVKFEVMEENDSYCLIVNYDGTDINYPLPLPEHVKLKILDIIQLNDYNKIIITKHKIKL